MKFLVNQLVFLLLCIFVSKIKTLPRTAKFFNENESIINQIVNSSSGNLPEAQKTSIEEVAEGDAAAASAEEEKKEVDVSDLLETANEPATIAKELHHVPQYELDWEFIDKETIRVRFDLYFVPPTSPENISSSQSISTINSTTPSSSSSRSLTLINALQYYIFIIRHYQTSKERSLEMGRLIRKETRTTRKHYSTTVLLTSLNHKDKYSVCLCYYQHNMTTQTPDLLLCQDIINDYHKFGHIRTDPRHGLIFILTQYSIILALLIVLQSLYTLRNRRFAQYIQKHVMQKAQSIRTTLSNVSLVRQSFSSLDAAAAEQQNQANHPLANQHEATIDENDTTENNIMISPPNIIVSEPTVTQNNSDEQEPFLRQVPSKNHVHFLLGPDEVSDDEDGNLVNEDEITQQQTNTEPYSDQSDALLSMAHILDTNKPWSRHHHHPAPV